MIYRRRRPWEVKGQIGTGAPPESPTAGWAIASSRAMPSGKIYHTLNVSARTRSGFVAVVVKQYPDGSFHCALSTCAPKKRRTLHAGDDSYAGCIHEQFTRGAVRGVDVPPTDAPATHEDLDFYEPTDRRSDDDEPEENDHIDDDEHRSFVPPF